MKDDPQQPVQPVATPSASPRPIDPTQSSAWQPISSPDPQPELEQSVVQYPSQPVILARQVAPVTQGTGYQIPDKKLISKGLLAAIISGAVALVALVAGLILYMTLFAAPGKAGYQEALIKVSRIKTANSDYLTYANVSVLKTEADMNSDMEKLKIASGVISDELASMEGLPAIKRDEEIKSQFAKVKDNYIKNTEAVEVIEEANAEIVPILAGTASGDIDNMDKKFQSSLLRVKKEINKKYIEDSIFVIEEMRSAHQKYSDSDDNPVAYAKYREVQSRARKFDREWLANVNKLIDEGSVDKELRALDDMLFGELLDAR